MRPAQRRQSINIASRLARLKLTWLTAYSQAKANKDCPAAYEKRLGRRLSSYQLLSAVPTMSIIGISCLAS